MGRWWQWSFWVPGGSEVHTQAASCLLQGVRWPWDHLVWASAQFSRYHLRPSSPACSIDFCQGQVRGQTPDRVFLCPRPLTSLSPPFCSRAELTSPWPCQCQGASWAEARSPSLFKRTVQKGEVNAVCSTFSTPPPKKFIVSAPPPKKFHSLSIHLICL